MSLIPKPGSRISRLQELLLIPVGAVKLVLAWIRGKGWNTENR